MRTLAESRNSILKWGPCLDPFKIRNRWSKGKKNGTKERELMVLNVSSFSILFTKHMLNTG